MRVEIIRECDGPEGVIPVGRVIDDPLSYVLVAQGLAKPLDEEAEVAAAAERLATRARAERKRRLREEARRRKLAKRARAREETRQRIAENMRARLDALKQAETEEPHDHAASSDEVRHPEGERSED